MISHGNGPQVGLLALQGSAYTAVDTYPLDVLGAQTEGMIGYMLEQELGNELPFERHLATLLTHDRGRRATIRPSQRPTKPIGPLYDADEAAALAAREGLGVHARRRQHAPRRALARAEADLRHRRDPALLEQGVHRDLRRRRRHPDHATPTSPRRPAGGCAAWRR